MAKRRQFPYYKVRTRDDSPGAGHWREIQRSYPSPEDAVAHVPDDGRWQIVEVQRNGRSVIAESIGR